MWTTKIASIEKNKDSLKVTVEFYKDDVLYNTQTYDRVSDENYIKPLIVKQLEQFNYHKIVTASGAKRLFGSS